LQHRGQLTFASSGDFHSALREVVLSDFQILIFEIAQVQGENPAIIQLGQKRRLSKAEKKKLKSKHD
jgi:hypothetical protein